MDPMRFLVLVACMVAAGCGASIRRHGYAIPDGQPLADCAMPIHNDPTLDLSGFDVLGRIEAHDSGFSTDCDEEVVLRAFAREACHVDAELINITEESRPDFWSTCYRAKADFLRRKDRAGAPLASDEKYAPADVRKRAQETHRRNRDVILNGAAAGVAGGVVAP
jgi:hypothetical protein